MLGGSQDTAGLLLRRIDGTKIKEMLIVQQRLNGGNDLSVAAGTQQAVNLRHFLGNLRLIALRHATGDQDLTNLTFVLQTCGSQNIVNGLGLCGVNEAAGIDDHNVTTHGIGANIVTGFPDTVHHTLAVHLILRTAQRNKSDICHNLS